ncbi:MAG: transketolase [Heliobacteriaceae bacterium]|jgi:transketolase|nr:transketolase [Heliobacteriaceae bacterium]
MLSKDEIQELSRLANESRRNIIKMVYNAQSGHIGGALSAADILTTLYHKSMRVPKPKGRPGYNEQDYEKRDRFVLSKGHASAALYSALSQRGYISKEDLMTFRLFGSKLQGHPTLLCPGVEAATGSLGQGLSIACGIAMALKLDENKDGVPPQGGDIRTPNVFVLMGDGELQEGSVWEGFMHASHRNLDNLIAIIDKNGLQIDGCTESVKSVEPAADKIKAFNWDVIEIDGHDFNQIYDAVEKAKASKKPAAIVARTVKGKGVSFMENNAGWHGTAPNKEDFEKAMSELKEK